MSLSPSQTAFLEQNHGAAMTTVGSDGLPRVARVAIQLVDGKLWSSGTQDRVRTRRLRRDPRCTLFVFDPGWAWLGIETTVRFLDGPDAPELNLRLFRMLQDQPTGDITWFGQQYNEEDFLRLMVDEQRLVYEFEVTRAYGMTP